MKFRRIAATAALIFGAMSIANAQNNAPEFRLCTGAPGGVYEYSGHAIKKFSDGNSPAARFNLQVINTAGSIENMDRVVDGSCDGAIVQNDAMTIYSKQNSKIVSSVERAGVLYSEYIHLVCNRGVDVSKISKIPQNTVISVGPDGGGAAMTWRSIVGVDPKHFSKIQTDTRAGVRALSAIADGTDAQCALFVTGLGNALLVNDAKRFGSRIVLVQINTDLDAMKDARGRQLYEYKEIPYSTYEAIMPTGFFGRKDVKTATVDAVVVVSTKWINENATRYDALIRNIASALPAIEKRAYNK